MAKAPNCSSKTPQWQAKAEAEAERIRQEKEDKRREKENENTINDLINTNYAIAKSINDIQIPNTPKLIICTKTQQFGCKCN